MIVLRVSVVKLIRKNLHHRDTEIAQRHGDRFSHNVRVTSIWILWNSVANSPV
jgi:hypothetical protein